MGNQLTAVASVNLTDVSTEHELIAALGEPGRSYVTSFHCLHRQPASVSALGYESPARPPSSTPHADGYFEDADVGCARQVVLGRQRRRRQMLNFVKHVHRQYSSDSGTTGDDRATASLISNSSTPSFSATPGTALRGPSNDDADLSLHGRFAEHYQRYRELFLHRDEPTDRATVADGTATTSGGASTTTSANPPVAAEQRLLPRADVPNAVRHLLVASSRNLRRPLSGLAVGGAGGAAGQMSATSTRDAPQDVVLKVFVAPEGNGQQPRYITEVGIMMRSVGEQLNAIEGTRTTIQRSDGCATAGPSPSPPSPPFPPSLPDGSEPQMHRGSSLLYYTHITEHVRGRFSLLQRPFVAFSLPERLQTRPYWGRWERLFACYQLLRAVQALHDIYGVVHGDVKPNNVLIQTSGWLYLTDLALYKPTHVPVNDPALFSYYYDTDDTRVCYLAPEKFVEARDWGAEADDIGVPATEGGAAPDTTGESRSTTTTAAKGPAGAEPGRGAEATGTPSPTWTAGSANVHGHTVAMDVFSAGCVVVYILTGKHLFHLSDTLALRAQPTEAARVAFVQGLLTDRGLTDPDLLQLLCHVLCSAPAERPSARQLLEAFTPRVFPPWFDALYEQMLPALLSQPADVQLRWLQPGALQETVRWCTRRAMPSTEDMSAAAAAADTARTNTATEALAHLLLPVILGAVQTAGTTDATLLGMTCLQSWFAVHICVSTLLDAILPCALSVANSVSEYPVTTRLIAMRVLLAIGVRVLQQSSLARCGEEVRDQHGESGGNSELAQVTTGGHRPSHRHPHTHESTHAVHDEATLLSITREGLFLDLLLPCFTEMVQLTTVEYEPILLELAQQLPAVLLLCRATLESSGQASASALPASAKGDARHQGDSPHSPSHAVDGTLSFSATLQDLLSSGWDLLERLYKQNASVAAALLEGTSRVVAFIGEDRVHRDLLPLLTTLIASPPAVQRQLYPQGVHLHALLDTPRPETLSFFVTEGLRQDDTLCLVRTLEALTAVLSQRHAVLPASQAMPCVHQAVPHLLSDSPLVFRAATAVVATAARVYRPGEVAVYLDAAVRPLLARADLLLEELDRAPCTVVRADLRSYPAITSTSSEQARQGNVSARRGTANNHGESSALTTTQALSAEERVLLLEHVQLRRTLTAVRDCTDPCTPRLSLFTPIDPCVVTHSRAPACSSRGADATGSDRDGVAAASVVAAFEEACPEVLLVPPAAASRTGPPHAALLARVRPFLEPQRCDGGERGVLDTEDDTQASRCRAMVPTTAATTSAEANQRALSPDDGVLLPSASVCLCPSRPLRPLSVPLASSSVHMGAIHSLTPLAVNDTGHHVLLSAGAREEALVWVVDSDFLGIQGHLRVHSRVPRLAPDVDGAGAELHSTPTYLAAQRLDAAQNDFSCPSVVLGASNGVVRYYDAHHERLSGGCLVDGAVAGAVTALDAYSPHVFMAGTAGGLLALIDARVASPALSSSLAPAPFASPSALVWSTRLESADGAISCLSALHCGSAAYAVVAATYGGCASLFDLRYARRVAHYNITAGMASTGAVGTGRGTAPSILAACPDPLSFTHSLRARFVHPGPAVLLGASNGHTYRLHLRTGELAVALQAATDSEDSEPDLTGNDTGARGESLHPRHCHHHNQVCDPHAVRTMLCQPTFGRVFTGSESGVVRRWPLPPCGAVPTPAVVADVGRESVSMSCPPVVAGSVCEPFRAPRALVSSTPALVLDECTSLWPEAARLTGAVREGTVAAERATGPRHRLPDTDNPLFPTASLRELTRPHRSGRAVDALFLPCQRELAALPLPRHHKDAVLALAALWHTRRPMHGPSTTSAPGCAEPLLASGSRDGTLVVWRSEST